MKIVVGTRGIVFKRSSFISFNVQSKPKAKSFFFFGRGKCSRSLITRLG